jgi:sRNA-binding regulator protein Hfq
MQLTLFNGTMLEGTLQGFSPYALTLATNGGDEVTVQKLAIAFYQVKPSPGEEVAEQDEES